MKTTGKYILVGHEVIEIDDLFEWARWIEHEPNRHVGLDWITPSIKVSTVFLGLDHNFPFFDGPPILFETMVFGFPPMQGYQERYATWEQAARGHTEMVAHMKEVVLLEVLHGGQKDC